MEQEKTRRKRKQKEDRKKKHIGLNLSVPNSMASGVVTLGHKENPQSGGRLSKVEKKQVK